MEPLNPVDQTIVNDVHVSLSSAVALDPSDSANNSDASAGTQVLHIPELLEMILDHVDIPEIMTVHQLTRGIKAIIDASPKQQRRLPLDASYTAGKTCFPFSSCLYRMPSQFRCFEYRPGPMSSTRATFYLERDKSLPSIGSRYGDMFIRLDPILETVGVYVRPTLHLPTGEPWDDAPLGRHVSVISSGKGLKIRYLYDEAKNAIAEYERLSGQEYVDETFRHYPDMRWQLDFFA